MTQYSPDQSNPLHKYEQLVFVTGMQGSGKTSVATAALHDTHSLLDMGPTMKAVHTAGDDGTTYEEWLAINEGSDELFVPKLIASVIQSQSEQHERCAIIGPRSIKVINTLAQLLVAKSTVLAYIYVPYNLRQSRYEARSGYQRTMDFQTAEAYNKKLGTHLITEIADVVVDNSGTFERAVNTLSSAVHIQ